MNPSPQPAPQPVNVSRQYREENDFVPYATYALIAACLLMYTFTGGRGGFGDTDGQVLVNFGSLYSLDVWQGQWWRLGSAMFLHGGLLHIGFNMYVLYSIGPAIERIYGVPRFLLIYLVSGWTCSMASLIWSGGNSVGASGAIFGLAGAFLAISLRRRSYFDAFGSQMLGFIAINIVIGFSGAFGNVDNFGHMGGLVGGFLLGNVVPNRMPEFKPVPARWAATLALVAAFAALTPLAVKLSQQVAFSRAAAQEQAQQSQSAPPDDGS